MFIRHFTELYRRLVSLEDGKQMIPKFSFAVADLANLYNLTDVRPNTMMCKRPFKKLPININASFSKVTYSMIEQRMSRQKSLKEIAKQTDIDFLEQDKAMNKLRAMSRKKERPCLNFAVPNRYKTYQSNYSPEPRSNVNLLIPSSLTKNTNITNSKKKLINNANKFTTSFKNGIF